MVMVGSDVVGYWLGEVGVWVGYRLGYITTGKLESAAVGSLELGCTVIGADIGSVVGY
jgi:hypothetical protein